MSTNTFLGPDSIGPVCLTLAREAGKVKVETYRAKANWDMQTDARYTDAELFNDGMPMVAVRIPHSWLNADLSVVIRRLQDRWPDYFEPPSYEIEFNEEVLASG